jgi:hypothetical protein
MHKVPVAEIIGQLRVVGSALLAVSAVAVLFYTLTRWNADASTRPVTLTLSTVMLVVVPIAGAVLVVVFASDPSRSAPGGNPAQGGLLNASIFVPFAVSFSVSLYIGVATSFTVANTVGKAPQVLDSPGTGLLVSSGIAAGIGAGAAIFVRVVKNSMVLIGASAVAAGAVYSGGVLSSWEEDSSLVLATLIVVLVAVTTYFITVTGERMALFHQVIAVNTDTMHRMLYERDAQLRQLREAIHDGPLQSISGIALLAGSESMNNPEEPSFAHTIAQSAYVLDDELRRILTLAGAVTSDLDTTVRSLSEALAGQLRCEIPIHNDGGVWGVLSEGARLTVCEFVQESVMYYSAWNEVRSCTVTLAQVKSAAVVDVCFTLAQENDHVDEDLFSEVLRTRAGWERGKFSTTASQGTVTHSLVFSPTGI